MAADRFHQAIRRLRWVALGPEGAGPTDRELLEQYVNTISHRTAAWAQRNGKWWRVYVEDQIAQ